MTEQTILITEKTFNPEEVDSPFGKRWGGELFKLTPKHLEALQSGETLAIDVMSEYVAFITLDKKDHAE